MADFNLKLTIQKLEEELSLYRNGLDGQQLLEMIMEKEEIIKQKDAQIQEEADKVVILYDKYKELASVKEDLDAENIKLLDELQQSQFLLSRRDGSLDDHEMTIKSLNETVFSLQDENKRLKEEIEDNRNVIAKLQERCGSVVKEKADINRKFKTEKAQFDDKITRYKVLFLCFLLCYNNPNLGLSF